MSAADHAMKICPNCGQDVPNNAGRCPNCGTEMDGVWPPPPEGRVGAPLGEEPPWEPPWKAKTEFSEGFFFSCVVGFVAWLVAVGFASQYVYNGVTFHFGIRYNALCYGPAALVQLAWSLLALPSRPHFARGIRASLLVTLAFFLGAFAVCR